MSGFCYAAETLDCLENLTLTLQDNSFELQLVRKALHLQATLSKTLIHKTNMKG